MKRHFKVTSDKKIITIDRTYGIGEAVWVGVGMGLCVYIAKRNAYKLGLFDMKTWVEDIIREENEKYENIN